MTTIADILGTDINISYEDGLRLSELMGTREQTLYQLDHIWASSILWIVMLMFLAVTVSIACYFLFLYIQDSSKPRQGRTMYEDDPDYNKKPRGTLFYYAEVQEDCETYYIPKEFGRETYYKKKKIVWYSVRKSTPIVLALIMFVVFTYISCYGATTYLEYSLNADLVNLNGQIDAILEKYV